jgi:MRG
MPDNLKSLLVDDWENVTKNLQVVALPAKCSVNMILDDYLREEKPKRATPADLDVLEEVIMGIKEYFDKSLDRILLYKFEREQYHAQRKKWETGSGDLFDKGPLDTYGAEHLTRLFGESRRKRIHSLTWDASSSIFQPQCQNSLPKQIWINSLRIGFEKSSQRPQYG